MYNKHIYKKIVIKISLSLLYTYVACSLYSLTICSLIRSVSTVCGPTLQYVGQKPFQSAFIPSDLAIDINITIIPGGFPTSFKFCILKTCHKNCFRNASSIS